MPVIDADTHVVESEATWSYLSAAERHLVPIPVVVDRSQGESSGALGGKAVASTDALTTQGFFWYIDGKLAFRGGAPADYPFSTRDMSDIPGRIAAMDRQGVDIQVLYPSVMNANTFRPEFELALCRSYNRWLADIFGQSGGRLRWVVAPPLQTMDQALAEVDFGVKHGACGVLMRGWDLDKPANDPAFDPLYRKAAECNLPMCVHLGIGGTMLRGLLSTSNGFTRGNLPAISTFQTVLTSGLAKRHPTLRWAIVENGSSWLPFALDRAWQVTRRGDERFTRPSTSLLEDNRIYVSCEGHEDLAYIIGWTGENSLVYGTDYGHNDTSTMVGGHNRMLNRTDVSATAVRKIMADNAASLYGI